MDNIYSDIQKRTNGEIYIGVVGPVRTGKSTFIRRFMELVGLPVLPEGDQQEVRDQLPVSGSGKMITTVEPKFIPKKAMEIPFGENTTAKIRLIDCVGFLVPEAEGNMDQGKERMVKTPWFDYEIPFHEGATIGTRKVINDHATLGILITTDGSFGELARGNFLEAEEKTIQELKQAGKPFVIVVNAQKPHSEEAKRLAEELTKRHEVQCVAVNCEQLRMEDVALILEKLLYEFPVSQMDFYVPKWVELLPMDHELKRNLIEEVRELIRNMRYIRQVNRGAVQIESPYVKNVDLQQVDLSCGLVQLRLDVDDRYYYEMLSDLMGVDIHGEYELIHTVRELAGLREEYGKVSEAMESVRNTGYGVVMPDLADISLEEPVVIHQGSKYGVMIKAQSPSVHMIRADIETEIAPIVGSETQAQDLITFIQEAKSKEEGIWKTNIFGKSIEQLVRDGMQNKIAQISDESQVKLQDSMKKIVNDSKGGMVCIII